MEGIFLRVLQTSLLASWGIALVFALRFFIKRVSHTYAYLLWGIVLFRLACPLVWEAPVGLLPSWESAADVFEMRDVDEAETVASSVPDADAGKAEIDAAGNSDILPGMDAEEGLGKLPEFNMTEDMENMNGAEHPAQTADPDPHDTKGYPRGWKAVSVIWALGVLLFWGAGIISYLRFRRNLGDTIPCPEIQEGEGRETGTDVKALTGLPGVCLSHIQTPFVMGIFRPRIYLPAHLDREEREYILLHEKTHIRRGDYLVKLLGFVLLGIHWFNPLVYAAFYFLERDMEMSCDEQVLKRLGSEIKREYAASLLKLSQGGRISFGAPLAFGERDARGRIRHVLDYRKPSFRAGGIALMVVLLAAAGLLFSPEAGTGLGRLEMNAQNRGFFYVDRSDLGEAAEIPGESASGQAGADPNLREAGRDGGDGSWDLRPVGEILDGLFEELMEGSPASGNPGDYVEARPEIFAEILGYRDSALAYCYTAFEQGGETGLKGHLMAMACREITGEAGNSRQNGVWQETESGQEDGQPYENGQQWYDAEKNLAKELEAEQGWDQVVKYQYLEGSILQFLAGDMDGYTEEIFLPDYEYEGSDETEKLAYDTLRRMAQEEEPDYSDGFSVWALWIHGSYEEGDRRKVIATVYEARYHLYGERLRNEGGSVVPMALVYESQTKGTGGVGEAREQMAWRLVSIERAGDGSYFLPSIQAFCTMPVSGEPIDGVAEAIVSMYGQDKDVAGPYGQDKTLEEIMKEHVRQHLEKWGLGGDLS